MNVGIQMVMYHVLYSAYSVLL